MSRLFVAPNQKLEGLFRRDVLSATDFANCTQDRLEARKPGLDDRILASEFGLWPRGCHDALGGRIYDIRYTEEQQKKYEIIFDKIPSRYEGLILDVGCGTGLLLERINSISVGVDLSINLLEKAYERNKRSQINLIQADAESLPIRTSVLIRYSQ